MTEQVCNTVDRAAARRRGIHSALRVAGLASLIVASVGYAAEPPPESPAVDGGAKIRSAADHPGMSCRRWRFWGPPAPPPMRAGAIERLLDAARWIATQFQRVKTQQVSA